MRTLAWMLAATGVVAISPTASAQGVLNVYCSVQAEWCTLVANEFQKATGVIDTFTPVAFWNSLATRVHHSAWTEQ